MNTNTYLESRCICCGGILPEKWSSRQLCKHCYRRSLIWGVDGAKLIVIYARNNKNFTRFEALEFCEKYYSGRVKEKHGQMSVLRTSLKLLHWNGIITEKRRRYSDYSHSRFYGYARNRRKRVQEGVCVICGRNDLKLYTHHLIPITWGGLADDEDNIVTVCKTHHLELHKRLQKVLTPPLLLKYLQPYRREILELVIRSLPDELKSYYPK
jgi:hypothetical protein